MEQSVIELVGVRKKRRSKTVGPIHLNIPKGYIIGLVGENGSGKSTLIHLLLQTLIPDEGHITWFGETYRKGIPIEIRQDIGYVSEKSNNEEDNQTAEEAASFRATWYPRWDQSYFESLMTRFHVPANTKLKKMSKGERRKFEIAVALAPRPKLLLMDEPSSGLDPFAWKMMIDELRDYVKDENTTILLSTHIVDEVRRLADYVILMHRGEMKGMVEKDSLLDNWKEIWISGSSELAGDLPGIVKCQQEANGVVRMTTTECYLVEKMLHEAGMTLLKTRSLELDEIMSLWLEGHMPADVQMGRGV